MKENKTDRQPISPEAIMLNSGVGIYAIKEERIGVKGSRFTETAYIEKNVANVEKNLLEYAEFVQKTRTIIENQGGVFNGIVEREIQREHPDGGVYIIYKVTYALAYKPETS